MQRRLLLVLYLEMETETSHNVLVAFQLKVVDLRI